MHLPSIAFCGTSVCQGSDFLQVSDLFLRSLWHSLQGVTHSHTMYLAPAWFRHACKCGMVSAELRHIVYPAQIEPCQPKLTQLNHALWPNSMALRTPVGREIWQTCAKVSLSTLLMLCTHTQKAVWSYTFLWEKFCFFPVVILRWQERHQSVWLGMLT